MVTLKFYTIQDKTAQVLKFHFKFIRGRYAKSILAIIPGLYFLKNFICFFFFFFFFFIIIIIFLHFVLHSSALNNEISGMLLSLEL